MTQYLSDRMYEKIRGQGWTYGASISPSVEDGRLVLSFVRSSNIEKAYEAFSQIVSDYTNLGQLKFYLKNIVGFNLTVFEQLKWLSAWKVVD